MATIIWQATTAKNWSDPTAWSGGIVPGPGDTVLFDENIAIGDCTLDMDASVNEISFISYYLPRFNGQSRLLEANRFDSSLSYAEIRIGTLLTAGKPLIGLSTVIGEIRTFSLIVRNNRMVGKSPPSFLELHRLLSSSETPDLTGVERTSNKVTSIGSSSTDTEYPSAKAVYTVIASTQTDLSGKLDKNTTVTNSVYAKGSTAGTQEMRGIVTAAASGSTSLITAGGVYTGLSGKENSITAGTTAQYYRGDKSWQTLNKAAVGLGSVDNTTDANKPVSTATQTALNAKADTSALAAKLDKSDAVGSVYATAFAGTQTMLTYTADATASTLVMRDANGRFSAAAPVNDSDVVNLATMNTALGTKADASAVAGKVSSSTTASIVYGTNSSGAAALLSYSVTATGNTVPYRSSTGTIATATATDNAHAVPLSQMNTALAAKEGTVAAGTTAQYYRGDKSWQTLNKSAVGLGNVDNTSDANKPVSTAAQTALDTKLDKNTTATNSVYVTGATAGTQTVRGIDTVPVSASTNLITSGAVYTAVQDAIGGVTPDVSGKLDKDIASTNSVYATGSTAGTQTMRAIVTTVTSGSTALITSGAVYTGLSGKENSITTGTTAQYYRGDKSWQTLNKAAVGLGNVDNTSDVNKPISTATQTALDTKAAATDLSGKLDKDTTSINVVYAKGSAAGTQEMRSIVTTVTSGSTALITSGAVYTGLSGKENTVTTGTTAQYYRGDKSWQALNKSAVGLSNVDNTSDADKPISTATQTALDAKASAADLSGKLDKQTGASKLYANDHNGSPAVYAISNGYFPSDGAGTFYTVTAVHALLDQRVNVSKLNGGTAGQVLAKTTATDQDYAWATLTKASVGLGNVDNTSDANKPISTAVQTALDAKAAATDLSGKLDKNTTSTNAVYAKGSATGTQEMRSIVTTVTSGSTSLVTSGAVYTAVDARLSKDTTATNSVYAKGSAAGTQEMRAITAAVTSGSNALVTSGGVDTKFADYLPARLRATEAEATSGSLLEADTLYFYPDP